MRKLIFLILAMVIVASCGKKKVMESEINYRDGLYFLKDKPFSGTAFSYNPTLWDFEIDYNKGEMTQERSYYKTGRLKSIVYYKNNKRVGTARDYYDNVDHQLEKLTSYKDGKEDGDSWGYFENGETNFYQKKKDGINDGEWRLFYRGGKLKERGMYVYGKEDGEWQSYDESGKLIKSENWDHGVKLTWKTFREQLNFGQANKEGKQDGNWQEFYKNGQIKETGRYLDDKKDGKWHYYSENGILIKTENWSNGVKQ